ncbi:MAG TPA: hypothetical protein VE944_09845 [Nostoc sp.]|nr:hypothetical protein [Nostoc sp.]
MYEVFSAISLQSQHPSAMPTAASYATNTQFPPSKFPTWRSLALLFSPNLTYWIFHHKLRNSLGVVYGFAIASIFPTAAAYH